MSADVILSERSQEGVILSEPFDFAQVRLSESKDLHLRTGYPVRRPQDKFAPPL